MLTHDLVLFFYPFFLEKRERKIGKYRKRDHIERVIKRIWKWLDNERVSNSSERMRKSREWVKSLKKSIKDKVSEIRRTRRLRHVECIWMSQKEYLRVRDELERENRAKKREWTTC